MLAREIRTWSNKFAPCSETQTEGGPKVRHYFEISVAVVSVVASAYEVSQKEVLNTYLRTKIYLLPSIFSPIKRYLKCKVWLGLSAWPRCPRGRRMGSKLLLRRHRIQRETKSWTDCFAVRHKKLSLSAGGGDATDSAVSERGDGKMPSE